MSVSLVYDNDRKEDDCSVQASADICTCGLGRQRKPKVSYKRRAVMPQISSEVVLHHVNFLSILRTQRYGPQLRGFGGRQRSME